ncbi:zinc-binding dehydrogenase [Lactiplantibacillus fabifermentans T30PCM01]|uniref:Zinc-binding dehydrogenase n=1 Tax=Lactiplantibacillus fabifermentans T30PCM01 TaxID=1400520 RepID=W6T3U2_9LACO|nr:NAD(P)-dependent alcohol dehydrogenase [Lactiplantibacillus fabifermentans]ETY72576.1 zinc-binding dehydrogenase [Lactiplantibacillus fabifermentans T30PCM01]
MLKVKALQADHSDFSSFHQTTIVRRDLRANDVAIDVKYCGICHSDISQVEGIDDVFKHPIVPGHEITGIVSAIGPDVTDFKVGDRVGVGCFIDSCGKCKYCLAGQEQFCERGYVSVFNTPDYDGQITEGGYSQSLVVKDHFVLHIPDNLDLAAAAPLLCAGITTYNPLVRYHIGRGSKVAIIGLGGLGHIAVQFANKLGAEVTVLGHSDSKRAEAAQFGATGYEILRDNQDFERLAGQFDFILNTAAVKLDLDNYLKLLTVDGIFCFVGLTMAEQQFNLFSLFSKQGTITVSNVGGLPMTQAMLNFAAANDVKPQIEMIGIDEVPTAYQRIIDSDVHYRFVIDMDTLK